MAMFRLRWRFFWSRRTGRRTVLALILALIALLASLYLAFPAIGQRQILDGLLAAVQGVGAVGGEPLLAVVIVICLVCSLALIIVPSYRRHSYLATTPSSIPPVSVYLDAENQLSEAAILPFMKLLITHLNGRRADLLSFLDASQTVTTRKYKALYLAGFRPIDVPHDPTDTGIVKEAVDHELAMHAYERALLGPPGQEFIIITGDADFVPLVYRLVALGHRVQIWAAQIPKAYQVVEKYLGIKLVDLSPVIPKRKKTYRPQVAPPPLSTPISKTHLPAPKLPAPKTALPTSKRKHRRSPSRHQQRSSALPLVPAPTSLAQPGEKQLYYAVADTIAAHAEASRRFTTDNSRNLSFHSLMHGAYGRRVTGIGYNVDKWLTYWLRHLIALGVLVKVDGLVFPQRGSTTAEDAARSLFAVSAATARVAVAIGAKHDDELVRIKEVAAVLAAERSAPSTNAGGALILLRRIATDSGRRIMFTRDFLRSARALRLLQFEDVPNPPDTIAHPRLPATPPAPNSIDTAHDATTHPPVDPPSMNNNDETV